jgi:hypothetical protein
MSASTTSLSARLYNGIVEKPLTWKAFNVVYSSNGCLSNQLYDTKLVTILKNVGYKTSMLSLAILGPIEWVARSSLSLVAYSFSLISTPIEWIIKAPVALYYKELPDTSISNKIYRFGYALLNFNAGISLSIGAAINNFIFYRNHLTQGLLD